MKKYCARCRALEKETMKLRRMNRLLSMLLAIVMVVGMVPMYAMAEDQPTGGETLPVETTVPVETGEAEETSAPTEETSAPTEETSAPTEAATEPTEAVTEPVGDEGIAPISDDGEEAAASQPIYILAGSDFQPTDGNAATGVSLVNGILDQIGQTYTSFDGFLFAGDYNYSDDQPGCEAGKAALQGAVETKFDAIDHQIYIQGNHDPDAMVGSTLSASGANDPASGAYGVFVINEKDYMWYNYDKDKATIQATASSLDAYLSAKLAAKYDAPIFIVSHLPLHYCLRTQVGGGDGRYAKYIFDVLQTYGEQGLNLIFLYGHNHSHGWDDYLGGASVYLQPGDSINIAQEGSTTEYTANTLAFTYMNAGFVAYYRDVNAGACTELTMTVFVIQDGQVKIQRYSDDGQHNLKCAGVLNRSHWTDGGTASCCNSRGTETYSADTTTVLEDTLTLSTFADDTQEPTTPEEGDNTGDNTDDSGETPIIGSGNTAPAVDSVTDATSGITVAVSGIESITVEQITTVPVGSYAAHASYDITVTGYANNTDQYATVTIPVPSTFAAGRLVTVWDGAAGGTKLTTAAIVNGTVTFTTNHFSTYSLTQSVDAVDNDEKIYILAGSDYHQSSDTLSSIWSAVQAEHSGITLDNLFFLGDYNTNAASTADTNTGIESLMTTLGLSLDTFDPVLVQGEHDYATDHIEATGGQHLTGYGVYVINEDAYPVGGGNNSTVSALATKLYEYLHTRMTEYPNDPVFILSYIPLLYSKRVADDKSGYYGQYLFEMINNAGHAGLNIVFIYGHNHDAADYDAYLGGEAVYIPKHTLVPVANKGETSGWTERTLQFTYMNAGYLCNYAADEDNTRSTMTLFTVTPATADTPCQVSVERFNPNGLCNLKTESVDNIGGAFKLADEVVGAIGSGAELEITVPSWHNVQLYPTGDQTADITVKVISSHDAQSLAPAGKDAPVVTAITDEAIIGDLKNELSYSGYYALNFQVNDHIKSTNGFFGTVMVSIPDTWTASNVVIYKIVEGTDDAGNTVYNYESVAYKITGQVITNGDGTQTVRSIAALRAFEGGMYAIACRQNQAANAPVQYHREDEPSGISSGTYLIALDASAQSTDDALILPVQSGTGLIMEAYPNITQYKILGVQQYVSDYEWGLVYTGDADARAYYFTVGSGASTKYLKISGGTLEFVTSQEEADAFQMEAVTAANETPAGADAYAYRVYTEKTVTDEDGNVTSSKYYLSYNIDQARVVSATTDATLSRFVFMQRKVFDASLGVTYSNPTVGVLKEVSGLGSAAMYTYSRVTTLSGGSQYLILPPDATYALSGYRATLEASAVQLNDGAKVQTAGTALEWTFTSNGNGYRISTVDQSGNTQYLTLIQSGGNNTYSLGLTTAARNATTWTAQSNTGVFTISARAGTGNRNYYLTYNADSHSFSSSSSSSSSSNIYLFGDREIPTVQGQLYAIADPGNDTTANYDIEGIYPVAAGTSEQDAIARVQQDVLVRTYTSATLENPTVLEDDDSNLRWVFADDYDPDVPGSYTLSITYGDPNYVSLGTVEVVVLPGEGEFKEAQNVTMSYLDDEGNTNTAQYSLKLDGQATFEINQGSYTADGLLAFIQSKVDVLRAPITNGTVGSYAIVSDSTATWTWEKDANGDPKLNIDAPGVYYLDVTYAVDADTTVTLGRIAVNVAQRTVAGYALTSYTGYVRQGSSDDTILVDSGGNQIKVLVTYTDGTIVEFPVTVAMLRDRDFGTDGNEPGKPISTKEPAMINYLDVFLNGIEVSSADFTCIVQARTVDNFPEYPDEGSVKVEKTATGIDFQSSGVARVELSASGIPIKRGVDVIIMVDTSSSMNYGVTTGTSTSDESQRRINVLNAALANMITTFKTKGADGEYLDIRVAIADFNGYSTSNTSSPYYLDDGTDYVGAAQTYANRIDSAEVYTGTGNLTAGAFVQAQNLLDSYSLSAKSGTNYDYALDAVYQLGAAIQQDTSSLNSEGEYDRNLYVVFLSDGAPFQWNYYTSSSSHSSWNSWISGSWTLDQVDINDDVAQSHIYYYDDDQDGDQQYNEHRMANAIKGDPDKTYTVIRKAAGLGDKIDEMVWNGTTRDVDNMYQVPGLGATMFAISFGINADQQITKESQITAIESIASESDGTTNYYFDVTTPDGLDTAFQTIASTISYAASQARFLDQMGDNFNLQMAVNKYQVVDKDGNKVSDESITPSIEILSYQLWTEANYLAGQCSQNQVGTRKTDANGNLLDPTILEVIMFSADGTKAYSSLIDVNKDGVMGVIQNADGTYSVNANAEGTNGSDSIMGDNGIIYAKTFLYNSTAYSLQVDGVKIPTVIYADGTTSETTSDRLPAETFYWNMDTITTSELAMRYYVYLTGSQEGTRAAGSYATNNYAVLYYDNYMENRAVLDTSSPTVAWRSATVSYAFYLVNSAGKPIVNQSTGMTGSFANRIALTNPVIYTEVLLNNEQPVSAAIIADSDDVLPTYYSLYDKDAKYTVDIQSSGAGSWTIVKGTNAANSTTYITQYSSADPTAFSNELSVSNVSYDYTHTVVWFAVVWNMQSYPDTVVIDYGLPVSISVMTNDMFGELGKLTGVGPYQDAYESYAGAEHIKEYATSYETPYGIAKVTEGSSAVLYTPKNMQMNTADVFGYEVEYSGSTNAGHYYSKVTVIPATSIYYEDSFLTFDTSVGGSLMGNGGNWVQEGKTVESTQDEDRPGQFSLTSTDANNVYGHDSAYAEFTEYSLGSAMRTEVKSGTYSTASFTFTGTGFDVISLTSNRSGTIQVTVTDSEGTAKKHIVDTYYGYTQTEYFVTYAYNADNSKWEIAEKMAAAEARNAGKKATEKPEAPADNDTYCAYDYLWEVTGSGTNNALYQIPVMKVEGLTYGTYNVEIRAAYNKLFDHEQVTGGGSYSFWLDAIRVYNPANDGVRETVDSDGNPVKDTTVQDAYLLDKEGWPVYTELRDKVLGGKDFLEEGGNLAANGIVYIDGAGTTAPTITDYASYGPNNELYLKGGNAIAFKLDLTGFVDSAGESIVADVQIGIKSADGKPVTATLYNVVQDKNDIYVKANEASRVVTTSTDMYYSGKLQCTTLNGDKPAIIVIGCTGDGILSITNIKITFTQDPYGTSGAEEPALLSFSISPQEAGYVLTAMAAQENVEPEAPAVPENPVPGLPTMPTRPNIDLTGRLQTIRETLNRLTSVLKELMKIF